MIFWIVFCEIRDGAGKIVFAQISVRYTYDTSLLHWSIRIVLHEHCCLVFNCWADTYCWTYSKGGCSFGYLNYFVKSKALSSLRWRRLLGLVLAQEMYGGLMAHSIDYVKEYFATWLLDTPTNPTYGLFTMAFSCHDSTALERPVGSNLIFAFKVLLNIFCCERTAFWGK